MKSASSPVSRQNKGIHKFLCAHCGFWLLLRIVLRNIHFLGGKLAGGGAGAEGGGTSDHSLPKRPFRVKPSDELSWKQKLEARKKNKKKKNASIPGTRRAVTNPPPFPGQGEQSPTRIFHEKNGK